MKKTLIVMIVLVVVAISPVLAQPSFGVMASLSDYSYHGDTWDLMQAFGYDNQLSLSYSIGVFGEIPVVSMFAIQPELLFTDADNKYGDSSTWEKNTWHFAEMPIYLKANVPVKGGTVYAMAGPELFYMLSDMDIKYDDGSTATATPDNKL